jgi:hypothetical protein
MNPLIKRLAEMRAQRFAAISAVSAFLDLLLRMLMVAAVILVMWAVIRMDGRTSDLEQRQYCNNVRDGLWPDYRKTYKAECGGEEPPKFHEDLTK